MRSFVTRLCMSNLFLARSELSRAQAVDQGLKSPFCRDFGEQSFPYVQRFTGLAEGRFGDPRLHTRPARLKGIQGLNRQQSTKENL